MRGHFQVVMNLVHVAGDQPLQPIGFSDETAQFSFVGWRHVGFTRMGIIERIPISSSEGFLDAGEKLGDGLESDGYSPVSAAMCAHASRRSVRLLETKGSDVASLLTFACVSWSRQNW